MKMPASFWGERPARAICVWVPSPQSNSHHSPSPTTARALTLRYSVGFPELVPSGIIFISKREYGINGNNGINGSSLQENFRLFRYFRLFRILSDLWICCPPAHHPNTRLPGSFHRFRMTLLW